MKGVRYISKNSPKDKRVLLRVDFNVSIGGDHTISDDARIREAVPTIRMLLDNGNSIVLLSHLGRPDGKRNTEYSLKPVVKRLVKYLPKKYSVLLVDGFETEKEKKIFSEQKKNELLVLENVRYWPGEEKNEEDFAKSLSALGEVFVNDAFGVAHRENASVVGLAQYLPSYGGLLLKREIQAITDIIDVPRAPVLSIIGGAKIESKVPVIAKLIEFSDTIFLGGAIANTFLLAEGDQVGESLVDRDEVKLARRIERLAREHNTELLLPVDVVVGEKKGNEAGVVCDVEEIPKDKMILDIGPQTQSLLGARVAAARTIIWNGPVGYNEDPRFARGTEFLFYSIAGNSRAKSLVGGGDTISSISNESHLEDITHISTGGGAMLEFIERETLPGIEALKNSVK